VTDSEIWLHSVAACWLF